MYNSHLRSGGSDLYDVFSDDPDSEILHFQRSVTSFRSAGGLLNCSAVVASSSPGGHGPCGAAHTMDVMGGIMVAAQFGVDATGGSLASTLDDYISTYDLGQWTHDLFTVNMQHSLGRRAVQE